MPSRGVHVNDLLKVAVEHGASDLHLKAGGVPMMRVGGALVPAGEDRRLDHDDMAAIAAAVLPTTLRERFKATREVDLAYSIPGVGRFRCNAFQQRGTVGMTFRVLPVRVPTIEELTLPPVLRTVAQLERGLVLVTGPAGCGKSTTLASMIDEINASRSAQITTIEDPIEYLHRDKQSVVCQREVGSDTPSFAHALRGVLRQDADVIAIGDMHDAETVETALLAAETGHLVFSTLHTLDAADTVSRLLAACPPHRQPHVRAQLAGVLEAVISQQLLPKADGRGRVPAVEVMITTPLVRECILDPDRTHLITAALTDGARVAGAQTFDDSIAWLCERGLVCRSKVRRQRSEVEEVGRGRE